MLKKHWGMILSPVRSTNNPDIEWMVKWLNARGIMILIKCKHVNREVEGLSPADII